MVKDGLMTQSSEKEPTKVTSWNFIKGIKNMRRIGGKAFAARFLQVEPRPKSIKRKGNREEQSQVLVTGFSPDSSHRHSWFTPRLFLHTP